MVFFELRLFCGIILIEQNLKRELLQLSYSVDFYIVSVLQQRCAFVRYHCPMMTLKMTGNGGAVQSVTHPMNPTPLVLVVEVPNVLIL